MKTSIEVENIKCGGCSSRIVSKLEALDSVDEVSIDLETGEVTYESSNAETKEIVLGLLKSMGYPLKGSGNKIDYAKSYVSCMLGRMQN